MAERIHNPFLKTGAATLMSDIQKWTVAIMALAVVLGFGSYLYRGCGPTEFERYMESCMAPSRNNNLQHTGSKSTYVVRLIATFAKFRRRVLTFIYCPKGRRSARCPSPPCIAKACQSEGEESQGSWFGDGGLSGERDVIQAPT